MNSIPITVFSGIDSLSIIKANIGARAGFIKNSMEDAIADVSSIALKYKRYPNPVVNIPRYKIGSILKRVIPDKTGILNMIRNKNRIASPIIKVKQFKIKLPYLSSLGFEITLYREKVTDAAIVIKIPLKSGFKLKGFSIKSIPPKLKISDTIVLLDIFSLSIKNASGIVYMGFVLNITATVDALVSTIAN